MNFRLICNYCFYAGLLSLVVNFYGYTGDFTSIKSKANASFTTGKDADLPTDFLDAVKWPDIPCAACEAEEPSRLVTTGIEAIPTAFDDWQPSPLIRLKSLEKDQNPDRFQQAK